MGYLILTLIFFIISCILAFRLYAVERKRRANDADGCCITSDDDRRWMSDYIRQTDLIVKACKINRWDYDLKNKTLNLYGYNCHTDQTILSPDYLKRHVHPDDLKTLEGMFAHMDGLDAGEINAELRYRFPDDEQYNRYVINGIAVENQNGEISKYTGMRRNAQRWYSINEELKTRNEELRMAKNNIDSTNTLLRTVIDRFPYCLYIKDMDDDWKYIIANNAFTSTMGFDQTNVIGKSDYELFDKSVADKYRRSDVEAANSNRTILIEDSTCMSGELSFWQTTKSSVTLSDGRRLLICLSIDITESKRSVIALKDAKRKAENSDKLKSAFLANMSHEIRTPLNAIVGFSELLIDTDDNDEKQEYLEIIKLNNGLLLKLISDILDLSKIESGILEIKREEFDLSQHFDYLASSFTQLITNENVTLIVDNPYRSCMVQIDRDRSSQVITNFVTNSIKFTDKGFIKMGYTIEEQGIRFFVTDTGIGISKDKIGKVFNRFEKLNDFAQGSGLGMAISKAIVEAAGGRIGLESEENSGSTFWAWIPSDKIVALPKTETETAS